MKDNLKTIQEMEEVSTIMQTETNLLVTEKMINSMVKAFMFSKMENVLREI